MYFDYETITPGNKVSNYEELESEIKSLINNSDSLSEERKKVRNLLYDKQNQNIVANRFINYLI
ncbi:CDP-glycerol:poly(glycerophosphate) glycerophosphotransferase [Clostridium sartagoforme AAU1]|uniref:CDP-glycerol:poly(Glycerophosphate) glycerophosphotransferase n=1 Tax=Clostridium sartagoforme AAU1 TaxID=1202534 RepID=R9C6B3_9CLOT|nr:CDP-glycerol:poly(glycerophosphate) glycerophosphotransferase [Clostridium sartagoforme AAU1]